MVMGTRTKFQLEILTKNVIPGIVYFCEIILESSRNVSETTPWSCGIFIHPGAISEKLVQISIAKMYLEIAH